jgi:molybdopterin synthase sulfur carrier subunit
MITVILYGQTLRQLVGQTEVQCASSGPVSVKGLLEAEAEQLPGVVALMTKGELLVTVNRKVATLDSLVRDGDTVKLTHQFNPVVDGATWHNP